MKTVYLKHVEVGAGVPKVIVPIVAPTAKGIIERAESFRTIPMHVVEWRVDFYHDALNIDKVLETLRKLREALGETPILFTFRTKKEGGEKPISMEQYTALNKAVAESGCVEAIDVEVFSGDDVVLENVRNIHAAGVAVVGSNHEFKHTPSEDDIIYRLRKEQDLGCDILKIAVMPQNKRDVITLLSATERMYTDYAEQPLITMSMAPTGVISRFCGEVFGSAMTFGAVGQTSAPGQVPVERLNTALEILHESM